MSALLVRLLRLAEEARLPNPLGRAAAMVNRHYNDGHGKVWQNDEYQVSEMRKFTPTTAERWRRHYRAGGSFKKLGISREAQLAERRVQDKKRREYKKEHGL